MKLEATARASNWGQADGTQKPIVRISGGRNTVAVEYDDLPRLIAELATLLHEQHRCQGDPNLKLGRMR